MWRVKNSGISSPRNLPGIRSILCNKGGHAQVWARPPFISTPDNKELSFILPLAFHPGEPPGTIIYLGFQEEFLKI